MKIKLGDRVKIKNHFLSGCLGKIIKIQLEPLTRKFIFLVRFDDEREPFNFVFLREELEVK